MLTRIITAVVSIGILIPILVFSGTWVFPVALGILALFSVFEITGCIGTRKKIPLSIITFCYTIGIITIVTLELLIDIQNFVPLILALTFAYIFLIFMFTMLSLGNTKFLQASELIALTIYILVGFMSIAMLRWHTSMGVYLYGLVFIGAWMTDTGAYFIGVLFGKHKLIPAVSPKKTVEGALGGVLGCIIGYVAYAIILQFFFSVEVNYLVLVLLAVIISIVSQIGDLIASYVKRECGIKDFGFIFPGHGGVMDRFDSIIAVGPAIYFILLLLQDYGWVFHA